MAEKKRTRIGVSPPVEAKSKKCPTDLPTKTNKNSNRQTSSLGKARERTKSQTVYSVEDDIRKNYRNKVYNNAVVKKSTKSRESKPQISDKQKIIAKIETGKVQDKRNVHSISSNKKNVKGSSEIKNNLKSATFIKEDESIKGNIDSTKEEYVYEDDFEQIHLFHGKEYESDFEECTDEEDDVASTHYDSDAGGGVTEEQNEEGEEFLAAEITEKEIVEPIDNDEDYVEDKEVVSCDSDKKRSHGRMLSGMQVDDATKEMSLSEETLVPVNESLKLNPSSSDQGYGHYTVHCCKREKLNKKEIKRVAKRGKQLLKMITLDEISFLLIELPPVPYEVLMRSRNHANMKQVSVQTNEDALTEGTQTDSIVKRDVWTQKPSILGSSGADVEEELMAKLGTISWSNLERFVALAGEVIIVILEEQMSELQTKNQRSASSTFVSEFSVTLGQEESFAEFWKKLCSSRPVHCAYFCKTLTNLLICSHGLDTSKMESGEHAFGEDYIEELNQFLESSILSVWNINEPSRPKRLLCCQGNVSKICIGEYFPKHQQLAFAGTDEGTIYLWDFNNKGPNFRQKIFRTESHKECVICPTFYTTGKQHLGRIVGLEVALRSVIEGEDFAVNNKIMSPQVCSLDEWGTVVVWSVIRKGENPKQMYELVPSMQLSLEETCAEWGKSVIPLENNLVVHRKRLSSGSEERNAIWKSLAVGCNCMIAGSQSGCIVYLPLDCDLQSVQIYPPANDSFASAECIAVNPNGLPFFMVGNSVGKVQLYDCISAQCITSWDAALESSQSIITNIAWSPQRPLVFFVVEDHSRLSVWDLALCDIYPIGDISAANKEKSTAFAVSYPSGNCPAYVAFGNEHGHIMLHQLKEQLWHTDEEIRKKEVSKFRKYVNHL